MIHYSEEITYKYITLKKLLTGDVSSNIFVQNIANYLKHQYNTVIRGPLKDAAVIKHGIFR